MKKLFLMLAFFLGLSVNTWAEDLEMGKEYTCEQESGSYDDIFLDFTYDATEDGLLVFTANSGINGSFVVDGGDEQDIKFSSPDWSNYYGKVQVEAGKSYEFSFWTWKTFTVSAELTHPVLGSNYDVAFNAVLGTNTLPAGEGETWYALTASKTGILHVSSEAAFTGGMVSIIRSDYSGNPSSYDLEESEAGVFDVTMDCEKNSTYFIKVNRQVETAEASFQVAIEGYPAGRSEDNPIVVDALPYEGSAPVGSTFYQLTVSAEDAGKMLSVAATTKLNSDWSNCSMYLLGDSWNSVYGDASLEAVVEQGTYIIKWVNYESTAIPFKMGIKTILPGQTIDGPLTAVAGDNDLADEGTWFHTWTATKNGKLVVTPSDASMRVSFPKGAGEYDGEYTAMQNGDSYAIIVEEGKSYLIKIMFATTESWFTLEEADLQKGESRNNPIVVENDQYTFGNEQTVWLSYTAPKSGKLTMSLGGVEYSWSNTLEYYTSDESYGESLSSINEDWDRVYVATTSVTAGQVILIEAAMVNSIKGKAITFSIADAQPGETMEKPVVAELNTVYTTPNLAYGDGYWFKLHLAAGNYRYYRTGYGSAYYYATQAEAEEDAESYSQSAYGYDEDEEGNSYFGFTLSEEGDVYFKLTGSTYGEGTVCFKSEAGNTPNLAVTIGKGGYSTFATTVNFTLPEGVEAYYATVEAGIVTLHKIEDVIAAGEGVILKGTEGAEVEMIATDDDAESILGNKLVGVTDPSTFVNNGSAYVISTQAGETAFYKYAGTSFPAGKAYLNAANATGAKMAVCFDEETAIAGIEAGKAQVIYNLQGQRIQKAQKGINIVNGKKVVLK